jgi:4-amino-4-deoxy-L-arabinose transferase-like glycosyltransferase
MSVKTLPVARIARRTIALIGAMVLCQNIGLLYYAFLVPNRDTRIFGGLLLLSTLIGALFAFVPPRHVAQVRAFASALVANEARLRIALVAGLVPALLVSMARLPLWIDEAANVEVIRSILDEGIAAFFANYGQYRWLGVQHPPLAPLLYSASAGLFGLSPLAVRLPNLFLASVALLATYEIGKQLLDRKSAAAAALLLPAYPLLFRAMTIANNDLLVIVCMILAVLATLRLAQHPSYAWVVALGLALGIGMVSKYTMLFAYPVALTIVLTQGRARASIFPLLAAFALSALLPAAWLIFQAATGLLDRQIAALLFYAGLASEPLDWNVPGATDVDGSILRINWLSQHLPLGIGVYNMPGMFMGLIDAGRAWGQSTQPKATRSIILWAAWVALPVLALLPQPRYLLPAFPALALLAAGALVGFVGERTRPVLLALCYCPMWLILYNTIERSITL